MIQEIDPYKLVPLGSLMTRSVDEELIYLNELSSLPKSVFTMISSFKTAYFIKGVLRSHDLSESLGPDIAFLILKISFGKEELKNLSVNLTNIFKIAPAKASLIAQEIEKELFGSIALELNSYLNQKKRFGQPKPATPPMSQPAATAQGIRNVVDLKQQTSRPPMAPPIPPNVPPRVTTQSPALPARPVSLPPKPPLPLDKDSLRRKSQLWQAK